MYLVDANVFLELLYKRDRWRECYDFLNKVEAGAVKPHVLRFTLYGVSAILGDLKLVSKFLSEVSTWRGLTVVDLSIDEEMVASELASSVGLAFDDGLQYYYAKKARLQIVSFDKDFDKTDVKRVEPKEAGPADRSRALAPRPVKSSQPSFTDSLTYGAISVFTSALTLVNSSRRWTSTGYSTIKARSDSLDATSLKPWGLKEL